MPILLCPARPGDVDRAVPLIYSAGPEAYEHLFREGARGALDYLRYAFVDGRGLCGYRNHTVAEIDGRLVGIGAFYSGVEYARFANAMLAQFLKFYGWRSPAVIYRAHRIQSWAPAPGRATQYVANLGVAPTMQGRGVGTALLRHGADSGRTLGKRKYALDVAATNPAAQRLYERVGLRVVRETSFPYRQRTEYVVPASRRMERVL